jgi:hypothetical protein
MMTVSRARIEIHLALVPFFEAAIREANARILFSSGLRYDVSPHDVKTIPPLAFPRLRRGVRVAAGGASVE